jgi:hypothetical protein
VKNIGVKIMTDEAARSWFTQGQSDAIARLKPTSTEEYYLLGYEDARYEMELGRTNWACDLEGNLYPV